MNYGTDEVLAALAESQIRATAILPAAVTMAWPVAMCDTIAKEHLHRGLTGEQVAHLIEGARGRRSMGADEPGCRASIKEKRPVVQANGYIG